MVSPVAPFGFGSDVVRAELARAGVGAVRNLYPCFVRIGGKGAATTLQHLPDPGAFEASLLVQGIRARVVALPA